jgi:hypothetical protein
MILLLGDSITEFGGQDGGWQQLLTRDYIRKVSRHSYLEGSCMQEGGGAGGRAGVANAAATNSELVQQRTSLSKAGEVLTVRASTPSKVQLVLTAA